MYPIVILQGPILYIQIRHSLARSLQILLHNILSNSATFNATVQHDDDFGPINIPAVSIVFHLIVFRCLLCGAIAVAEVIRRNDVM